MKEPIKAGDLAEVISGAQGSKSPNIGLIVCVKMFVGEHSKYGKLWRCEAEFAERFQNGVGVEAGMSDFAQDWLRKIEPPKSPDKAKAKPLETA